MVLTNSSWWCLGLAMVLLVVVVRCSQSNDCAEDKLIVYRVTLETKWCRDSFPKHFPEWRPPAQWSKLLGLSHGDSFVLFRLGRTASPAMKLFAETGRSDVIDEMSQGEGGVYDEFNAPPITEGIGQTEAEFFVDGKHPLVSLVSRIVPSPDWFIGVDSFNLCDAGRWIDSVAINVHPVDAGTDKGLTFTAPNWSNYPQEKIYQITSRFPNHPAGSFYYPNYKNLPTIATFRFSKVKEYELSREFHYGADVKYDVITIDNASSDGAHDVTLQVLSDNQESNIVPLTHRSSSYAAVRPAYEYAIEKTPYVPTSAPAVATIVKGQRAHRKKPHLKKHANKTTLNLGWGKPSPDIADGNLTLSAANGGAAKARVNEKNSIIGNLVRKYRKGHRTKKYRKSLKPKDLRKIRPPRDCRVGPWKEWTPCSRSCGIGESQRTRSVIKHSRRGGKPCPALTDTRWCGSSRSCPQKKYFDWSK